MTETTFTEFQDHFPPYLETHLTQSTSEPPITPITPITPIFLGVDSSWTTHSVNRGSKVDLICAIGVICGSTGVSVA